MKINSIVKKFLNQEYIKDLINEGKIDETFREFMGDFLNNNEQYIVSIGEVIQQLYNLINKVGIKYKEGYSTKLFKFISNYTNRRVYYILNKKQGYIADIDSIDFNPDVDDFHNFNELCFTVAFDDSTEGVTPGINLKLL